MIDSFMRSPRFALAAAVAGVAVGSLVPSARANSYASGITESAGTVSFILNENASDVTVYRDGVATSLGALGKGSHSFTRDGAATYHIQVSTTAAPAGYTLISTDTNENNFELPRGVAVNTNPSLNGAPNPYFGRVYVANGRESSTAAGRTQGSGIYLLNADLTSAVGQGNTARTAGIPFATGTDANGNDPFRLQVGPDNRLYVTSFLDSRAGLRSTDPDVVTNEVVFDDTGRSSIGLNTTSGNVTDLVIQGTGAGRTIYTSDEDLNGSQRGIYQYNIGTTTTFTGAPINLFSDPDNLEQNGFQSIARSPDGTFWLSQNRAGGADTLPSLIQVDAAGTVLFNSIDISSDGTSLGDPLRRTQGIAFDPVNDVIALVTNEVTAGIAGEIIIFDDDTKTILDSFTFNDGTTGSTNTDVAFDAAGNLYVGNRSTERLRIWSPGGDSIFTIDSVGNFYEGVAVIPEPSALALLGVAGFFGIRRRR